MAGIGDLFGPIANAMIMSQYIGICLLIGGVLLFTCILPFKMLRKTRALVGVLFILIAVGLFVSANTEHRHVSGAQTVPLKSAVVGTNNWSIAALIWRRVS